MDKAPSYARIEREIRTLDIEIAKAEVRNLPTLGELQAKGRELKAQAAELMQKHNVDVCLFEAKGWARCKEFGDSGTLPNGKACVCWKVELN